MNAMLRTVLLVMVLAVFAPASHADTVTTRWNLTITSVLGDADPDFIGRSVLVTATYDDAGTFSTLWNDGPNEIPEFGGGDDTVNNVNNLMAGETFRSDADMVLSMLPPPSGNNPFDATTNASAVYDIGSGLQAFWSADGVSVFIAGESGLPSDIRVDRTVGSEVYFAEAEIVSIPALPTTASIPTLGHLALLLLTLMMAGQACFRIRRQSAS